MKNKINKEDLEQEIRDLEKEVYDKTGYKNDRPFIKTQYEEAKKEYKRDKKKVQKIKNIRNLKVTGYISLMLLPFVVNAGICCGAFSFVNKSTADKEPVNAGDEIKVTVIATGFNSEKNEEVQKKKTVYGGANNNGYVSNAQKADFEEKSKSIFEWERESRKNALDEIKLPDFLTRK